MRFMKLEELRVFLAKPKPYTEWGLTYTRASDGTTFHLGYSDREQPWQRRYERWVIPRNRPMAAGLAYTGLGAPLALWRNRHLTGSPEPENPITST